MSACVCRIRTSRVAVYVFERHEHTVALCFSLILTDRNATLLLCRRYFIITCRGISATASLVIGFPGFAFSGFLAGGRRRDEAEQHRCEVGEASVIVVTSSERCSLCVILFHNSKVV